MSAQRTKRPRYQKVAPIEFARWFATFCAEVKATPRILDRWRRAIQSKSGFDPSFVAFTLYWYTYQGRDRAGLQREVGRERVRELRNASRKAAQLGELLASIAVHTYKAPFAYEIRDVLSTCSPAGEVSSSGLAAAADTLSRWAPGLNAAADLLAEETSQRRLPRTAYMVSLVSHLRATTFGAEHNSAASDLLACAYAAAGFHGRSETPGAIDEACGRYESRYPSSYAACVSLGERNKLVATVDLTPWAELRDSHIDALCTAMAPRLEAEKALGHPRSVPARASAISK